MLDDTIESLLDWSGEDDASGSDPHIAFQTQELEVFDTLAEEATYRACEAVPGGLRAYCQRVWSIVEPGTQLSWTWFHDAICDHLEAVTDGSINRLVITIPPRHLKSTLVAVMWPTWEWGPRRLPHRRVIFASYAQALSVRDSQRRRLIMASQWYQTGWGDVFSIGKDRFVADHQVRYQNSFMGQHLSTSVTGSNTGEGGECIVLDDPHNMVEIHSEASRAEVIRFNDEVLSTRINDPRRTARVLVMQRGHEADLAGHVLKQGGYIHLNLQAEFDPRRRCTTRYQSGPSAGTILFQDPRTSPGELLFPERFPAAAIDQFKRELGDHYAAQFQQDPTPAEGGIFKRSWWRYWVPAGHLLAGQPDENGHPILVLPSRFQQRLDSWDMTFKDTEGTDFVVGLAFGRSGSLCYLLQMARGRFDFVETQHQVQALRRCHPQPPNAIYVEEAANGAAILRTLRDVVPGLLGSLADRSKLARANAASPRVKAGNYIIPHPSLTGFEWVARQSMGDGDEQVGPEWSDGGFFARGSFLNELTMFPNAANDDQVDAFTQADHYLLLQEEFGEDHFAGASDRDDLY